MLYIHNIKDVPASRDLRCLRNTIHTNLFITYIFSALLWILTFFLQVVSTHLYIHLTISNPIPQIAVNHHQQGKKMTNLEFMVYLQMTDHPSPANCICLVILLQYFNLTNFFWMLVEGRLDWFMVWLLYTFCFELD